MNDEYILTYFFGKNHKRLNKNLLNDIPKDILEYLNNRYSDSSCILETLERIKKNINVHPICESCGKPVKYVGSTRMFLNSCGDYNCEKKIIDKHYKETCIKKYGTDNPAKNENIKLKMKITNINRYGTYSPLQNKDIHKKTVKTNIEKYGLEISQSSDIVKNKMSLSNKRFWENIENKEEFINKIISKIKDTCINKYGVSNPMKVKEIHDKILPKIQETKNKNGTFNTSNPEDESYILLKEKYPDIIRQYHSEVYPFNCDFYIPSIDTYIECNYFWTHGGQPFTSSNENIIKLNKSKSINKKFYTNAIETWTIRDVNKRKIAKENNLNYLEFFNINTLKGWIKNN